MKKIITLLFLIVAAIQLHAQPLGNPKTDINVLGGLKVDSLMLPPLYSDTPTSARIKVNGSLIRVVKGGDTGLYVYVAPTWRKLSQNTGGAVIPNLDQVLNAGDTGFNKKMIITKVNVPSDSNIIDVNGSNNFLGIRVFNHADTSTNGHINTAAISVLNYQGKGLIMRTYGSGVTGFSALCNTGDSAMILQSSNGQPIIFEYSVGHGYDAFGFFGGTNKSLNLSSDLVNHMAYSNHNQNLYVGGNAKFNNSITVNDTGRGYGYFYAGNYNDAPNFYQKTGFRFVTIKSDSSKLLAQEMTGDGDLYVQKRQMVGQILTSDTLKGIFNVTHSDLANYPLVVLDRSGNSTSNIMEFWRYSGVKMGYMDAYSNLYLPKYYATSPTRSGTTPDSVISYVTATGENIVSKAGWVKTSDTATINAGFIRNNTTLQTANFNISGQGYLGTRLNISNGSFAPTGLNVTGGNRMFNQFSEGATNVTQWGNWYTAPGVLMNTFIGQGTAASPTALTSTNQLWSFAMNGYDGAAYRGSALMEFYASDNWSSGYAPTNFHVSIISYKSGTKADKIFYSGLKDAIYFMPSSGSGGRASFGGSTTINPHALLDVHGQYTTDTVLCVNGITGQSVHLQVWQVNSQTLSYVDSAGGIHAPNVLINGSSTQSGNASATTFNIAHGLGTTPTWWFVTAASADAANISYVTADATNIIVHYSAPPASGTNNLTFKYSAK